MSDQSYDVLIIGGGPGGYVAGIRAGQLGLKTAVVERDALGGICLSWGCIPTKALLKNAAVVDELLHAKDWGLSFDNFRADYGVAHERSRKVSDQLVKGVEFLMRKNKIEVFKDEAVLKSASQVELKGGQKLDAKSIIIATGARARSIPGLELDGKNVISYREALELKEVPSPLVIVGASAIGVEFASVFHPYGADITVLEALPHLLPKEDEEVSKEFEKQMQRRGIKFKTNAKVEKAEKSDGQINLYVTTPQGSEVVSAQKVLVAIGVQPNSDNLGLESLGVATNRGAITVNEYCETNVPNVYAIGDVNMLLALAHVASAQGVMVVEKIAGKEARPIDYNAVPRCTYSMPQVASLGLTEAQARAEGHELSIGKFPFRANGKALSLNEPDGFIKIIADQKFGEILGVHMIGPEVTDLTGEFSLAKSMELTPMELAHAIHAHPTLTEVIGEAALATMGEALHI
jgi:dihydrolipoamide dehydrogenase